MKKVLSMILCLVTLCSIVVSNGLVVSADSLYKEDVSMISSASDLDKSLTQEQIYINFLNSFGHLSESNFGGKAPTDYAIIDINQDGIRELLVQASDGTGFYITSIYTLDVDTSEVILISSDGYCYGGMSYSSKYKCLEFVYPRPAEWEGIVHFSQLLNNKYTKSFELVYSAYESSPRRYCRIYDEYGNAGSLYDISEEDWYAYLDTCDPIKWVPIYKETSDGILYLVVDGKVVIAGLGVESSSEKIVIPSTIEGYPVTEIQKLAISDYNLREITIPSSVVKINDSAFNYCFRLQNVHYDGTRSQWDKIKIGDNNDYLLEAILSTNFDPLEYPHPYSKVVYDALQKTKMLPYKRDGYGILYDIDDNGIDELIFTYSAQREDASSGILERKCSVYTLQNKQEVSLISDLVLYVEAGAQSEICGVVEKDGKKYLSLENKSSRQGYSYGFWDLYSVDGSKITKVLESTFECNSVGSEIIYSSSSGTINGIQYSYSEYLEERAKYNTIKSIKSFSNSDDVMTLEELLKYTKTMSVEENIASYNIKVYSSYPNSEIGVEQEVKLFVELYENDTLINSENGYSIVNSNSSVVKVLETYPSNDGYFFTLKGLSEGSTDFTIIDSITNTSTTIPINVVDKSEFYRCSVSFDCLNVNDIYITGYSCVVNDYGNHNITFNAYNWSYSYGVAEVYDSNGKIIKAEPINPRNDGSGTEKIVNGFRYAAIDLSSDKEWYKKESNTKHTPIELVNIPVDSKIVITTDPKVSGIASLYTGVDVFAKVVLTASTLNIKTDAQQATVKALLTEALKSLPESALKSLSSELSKSMTAGATSESVSKTYEIIFNMFESIGLDYGSIIKSTLMGMGYGAVDSVITTLIPATQVVSIVDDVLAILYPIVDYSYSIDKGKAEIHITKHGLQNYLTNNSVTITQNSDFGKETILDAYIVVEESELQRLPDSIAGDMVYYNIYNITLRENNREVQPNEEIEVRIPIPPNADGRKCVVYRIEDNGERTYIPARIDDWYLVFNTTHLSYYVVGQKAYEYGDVNKDGNLNIKDATAIQKYLASLIDFDEEAIRVADYNKDTKITIKDATAIQKKLAGLI